jgi:myo-inositol-1(or 4)-monophosphatase
MIGDRMTAVDFAAFVHELATLAGEAIMPFFRTSIGAEDKSHGGKFDPVTEADKAAEVAIRRRILTTFPGHGVVGEEFADHLPDAEYCWVIDPIDGTKSFISGMPLWGTLIGLTHNGEPVFGMMHQPFTSERFFGDGGEAKWRHAQPGRQPIERVLRTRSGATLATATLMTTNPHLFPADRLAAFKRVEHAVRLSRYGGDCYAYCMLAAGHVDLVIESGLKPYDIVALIPIIEGAGGIITSWQGGSAAQGGAVIAAGNEALHAEALKLLAGG